MVPAGLQTMDDLIRVIDDHLKTHGIRFDARVKIRVTLFERKVVRYVVQNTYPPWHYSGEFRIFSDRGRASLYGMIQMIHATRLRNRKTDAGVVAAKFLRFEGGGGEIRTSPPFSVHYR